MSTLLPAPLATTAPAGSPDWWLQRLLARLVDELPTLEALNAYYAGFHPLPDVTDRARLAYQTLLAKSRSNWMGLVVDAVAERLDVVGFRAHANPEDTDPDEASWDRWQSSGLDAQQELLFTDALVFGRAYALVDPYEQGESGPRITVESPLNTITQSVPGRPDTLAAALKVWSDEDGRRWYATVYMPDRVVRYTTESSMRELWPSSDGWERREDVDAVVRNPLGQVPIVRLPNRPRSDGSSRSELADVIDIQDRINETIFNRLLAARYAAFRQKWITGMEIPVDPDTGQAVEPFNAAVDRLWMAADENAKFGEFSESDLAGYIKSVEADIQHLAAITRTPPHYLLGQSGAFPSGESLKATETGLVAKVKRRQRHFGEALERLMRLAARAAGDTLADSFRAEVVWRDPESRTEGELVDALVKMAQLGVPFEVLWERWGASPQDQQRWMALNRRQVLNGQGLDLDAIAEAARTVPDA